MKNILKIGVSVGALLLAVGCSHAQKNDAAKLDARDQAEQAAGKIPQTWQNQRDDYANKVENRIHDYDQRLNDLKSLSLKQSGNDKKNTDNMVKDLQSKTDDLRKKLGDMKTATADNWTQRRQDVDGALAKAEDVYNHSKQVATSK